MGEAHLRRSRRLVGHLPEISETFPECFICLEKMELCFPVVVRLPCCQNFCHRQELDRWLDTNNSCPLCRAVIEVEQPNVPQNEAFHVSLNEREALAGRVLNQSREISDTSLAFLDIKISIESNGLCTSVYYKPTDSHSYLVYSSSPPSKVKNSIPFSQFLRLRRLCSDDSVFSEKLEVMCQFFDKHGYPVSFVQAGRHRAQQIDRQSALQTAEEENSDRIRFTLTFHPHNHAVKSIILKNSKRLQNDSETSTIFSQPSLILFKHEKT